MQAGGLGADWKMLARLFTAQLFNLLLAFKSGVLSFIKQASLSRCLAATKQSSPVVQDAHVDRLGALVLVVARRQRAHALAPNVARQVNLQRKTGKYSAQQCLSGQSAADSVQRATHTCPTRLEQRSQE